MPYSQELIEAHPLAVALVVLFLWAVVLSPLLAAFAVWRHLHYMRKIAASVEILAARTLHETIRESQSALETYADARDRILKAASGQ